MASQDNEVESEKDKTVGQAGTVEDAVKDAQTTPVDDNDELAKWKAMSRKNEDRASANYKAFQSADAELKAAKTQIARLEAKAKYPQITDAVLSDLCPATEPEAIASWAEKYAAYNPIDTSKVERKPQQTEDALARKVAMQAEFPSGTSHPKRQPGDAYKRVMERQKARKRSK